MKLSEKLKEAKKRKPDAYIIIGTVSGLGKKRVEEIANGSQPTVIEESILNTLS